MNSYVKPKIWMDAKLEPTEVFFLVTQMTANMASSPFYQPNVIIFAADDHRSPLDTWVHKKGFISGTNIIFSMATNKQKLED